MTIEIASMKDMAVIGIGNMGNLGLRQTYEIGHSREQYGVIDTRDTTFLNLNTDAWILNKLAHQGIVSKLIGVDRFEGQGSGWDPEAALEAYQKENETEIMQLLLREEDGIVRDGVKFAFVIFGTGRGTGTKIGIHIVRELRKRGVIVIANVAFPTIRHGISGKSMDFAQAVVDELDELDVRRFLILNDRIARSYRTNDPEVANPQIAYGIVGQIRFVRHYRETNNDLNNLRKWWLRGKGHLLGAWTDIDLSPCDEDQFFARTDAAAARLQANEGNEFCMFGPQKRSVFSVPIGQHWTVQRAGILNQSLVNGIQDFHPDHRIFPCWVPNLAPNGEVFIFMADHQEGVESAPLQNAWWTKDLSITEKGQDIEVPIIRIRTDEPAPTTPEIPQSPSIETTSVAQPEENTTTSFSSEPRAIDEVSAETIETTEPDQPTPEVPVTDDSATQTKSSEAPILEPTKEPDVSLKDSKQQETQVQAAPTGGNGSTVSSSSDPNKDRHSEWSRNPELYRASVDRPSKPDSKVDIHKTRTEFTELPDLLNSLRAGNPHAQAEAKLDQDQSKIPLPLEPEAERKKARAIVMPQLGKIFQLKDHFSTSRMERFYNLAVSEQFTSNELEEMGVEVNFGNHKSIVTRSAISLTAIREVNEEKKKKLLAIRHFIDIWGEEALTKLIVPGKGKAKVRPQKQPGRVSKLISHIPFLRS